MTLVAIATNFQKYLETYSYSHIYASIKYNEQHTIITLFNKKVNTCAINQLYYLILSLRRLNYNYGRLIQL